MATAAPSAPIVDRALRCPPVLELLLVLRGLPRQSGLSSREVRAGVFDLLLESEHAVFGGADLLVDAIDLVQDRAVFPARLNASELPLILLEQFLLVMAHARNG